MSLCALIYYNMKGISNPGHLKQIMHIGNQLYSSLSKLSRQSFSLLTELPTMQVTLIMSMVRLLLRDINTA